MCSFTGRINYIAYNIKMNLEHVSVEDSAVKIEYGSQIHCSKSHPTVLSTLQAHTKSSFLLLVNLPLDETRRY